MAVYTYLYLEEGVDYQSIQESMQSYIDKNTLDIDEVIEETHTNKAHWQKRKVGELINSTAQKNDTIVVFEAAHFARSTSQMLEILMAATNKGINIHFVKYSQVFHAQSQNKLSDMLSLMQHIESDFISRRTTDALARRRAAGLPLGRPKGRKNKSLKLDKNRKDIVKYLELGISKASIAKLVGCHPQTLYDWIDRNGILDDKARRQRKPADRIVELEMVASEEEVLA